MIKKQINLNYFDEHIASLIFKSLSKTKRAFVGARKAGMTSVIAHQTRSETPTSIGFTPLCTSTIAFHKSLSTTVGFLLHSCRRKITVSVDTSPMV